MANQFLIKNKMADMRGLSASEILSLQGTTPTYAGVELLGYYEKGDTPAPIIYYPSTTADPDNGGGIIKIGDLSLTHKFSEVDVRYYGVSGTGDETDRLQKILDLHSVVVIDSLEINIRAHDVNRPPSTEGFTYLIDKGGVSLNNNQHLIFKNSARLKAINVNHNAYNILRIINKSNITIDNLNVLGTKGNNTAPFGEWGYGIAIMGSRNINVNNSRFENCFGDGINLQVLAPGQGGVTSLTHCRNIVFNTGVSTGNRRQGMSIESGIELYFNNFVFENTEGTAPQCGVDIEPWGANNTVDGVYFDNCIFKDNRNGNFLVDGVMIKNVYVTNCRFVSTVPNNTYSHIHTSRGPKSVQFINCFFDENATRTATLRGGEIEFNNCLTNSVVVCNEVADGEIYYTKSVSFKNCNLHSISSSKGCQLLAVRNSVFTRSNIYIDSPESIIENSTFKNVQNPLYPTLAALHIANNITNCQIKGNSFEGLTVPGIVTAKNTKIINNVFLDAVHRSIYLALGTKSVKVIGNNFMNSTPNVTSDYSIHLQDIYNSGNNNIEIVDNFSNSDRMIHMEAFGGNFGLLNYSGNVYKQGSTYLAKTSNSRIPGAKLGEIISLIDNVTLNYKIKSIAPWTVELVPSKSVAVSDAVAQNSVKSTVSDASDLTTALVLVNEMKAKYNLAVDLINELKVKLNAKLTADRSSGQQAN